LDRRSARSPDLNFIMGRENKLKYIGWVIVVAHFISDSSVEFKVVEAEKRRNSSAFEGRTFYSKPYLHKSYICPSEIPERYIFRTCEGILMLQDKGLYAVLIDISGDAPRIMRGDTLEAFNAVRNTLDRGKNQRYRVTFVVGEENKGTEGDLSKIIANLTRYLPNDVNVVSFLKSPDMCWYQEIGGTFEHSPRMTQSEILPLLVG